MMFVTFDHNLLIDLEADNSSISEALRQLVSLHDSGQIAIRVSAIGASERLKGKTYAPDFAAFQKRVFKLSDRPFEILRPLSYWGITYGDWGLWGGNGTSGNELEQRIHAMLFPETEFNWSDFAQANKLDPEQAVQTQSQEWQKWRNRKCDVLTMWCHINYSGDIFVTTDNHFHQSTKKPALVSLGARSIAQPAEAVPMVTGPK
jgi:hypothetical protein